MSLILYLIGLGLGEKDITLKAMEALESCEKIYVEFYTNRGSAEWLEKALKKKIAVLGREEVESDMLIKEAREKSVALLVGGDCLSATTHIELFLEAKKSGTEVKVIHAPSIFTAVAETGVQLYKLGRTTTLVKEKNYFPGSPYDIILQNRKIGLHTLVLLDVGMDIPAGLGIIAELESRKKGGLLTNSTKVVACCRLGTGGSIIRYAKIHELVTDSSFKGKTPACIIMPGELNFKEEEVLELWTRKKN